MGAERRYRVSVNVFRYSSNCDSDCSTTSRSPINLTNQAMSSFTSIAATIALSAVDSGSTSRTMLPVAPSTVSDFVPLHQLVFGQLSAPIAGQPNAGHWNPNRWRRRAAASLKFPPFCHRRFSPAGSGRCRMSYPVASHRARFPAASGGEGGCDGDPEMVCNESKSDRSLGISWTTIGSG